MIIENKKVHTAVLVIIFGVVLTVCSLQFSVSAAMTGVPSYAAEEMNAYINEHMEEINAYINEFGEEYYAYMNLDEAEETLKPIILEARWRIISRESWVADDINGYIQDEAGNIIEIVPHFHDVFPEDWEIQPGRGTY